MKNKDKLIPKAGQKPRRKGNRHMIVEVSDSCVNLTNVYSLNGTAARPWEMVCNGEGRTAGELAEGLCKTYDVEYGRALRDVERQIEEWEKMGLLSRRGTGD